MNWETSLLDPIFALHNRQRPLMAAAIMAAAKEAWGQGSGTVGRVK